MSIRHEEALGRLGDLKNQLEELRREIAAAEVEAMESAPVVFYTVGSDKGYLIAEGADSHFTSDITKATKWSEEGDANWEAKQIDGWFTVHEVAL